MKLTADNVGLIYKHCLMQPVETELQTISVQVIGRSHTFNVARLQRRREDVKQLLATLPEKFMQAGGASYLMFGMTARGQHWTRGQEVGQLIALGMALGLVHYARPPEEWGIYPGGIPNLVVSDRIVREPVH